MGLKLNIALSSTTTRAKDASGDDAALVGQAQSGDRAAFGHLVGRYQGSVRGLAYALTGSFTQSEEVAQETFLLAWRRLPEMREPDRFHAWVLGIARNFSLRMI